jgi:two-component system, OmpR family, sensor histidine kinase TctE
VAANHHAPMSLRRSLLLGILLPILLFVVVDTISLYRQALDAVNTAYDRTLLASAKAIGELLDIEGDGAQARLRAQVPYSALEAFEVDNRSRMNYRISDAQGQWVDGVEDLPAWRGVLPNQGPYAALVDFYDDTFRGDPVRVAVLLQPVATRRERTMAMVQVAETLELRRTLARQILIDTLQRQAILITVITAVVLVVVQRVTRPVRRMSSELQQRPEDDLTPLNAAHLPLEIRPLTDATNQVMQRLHQLRTPLAVLKVQVQSALRGDVAPTEALQEIQTTVDRATQLANQMLNLAKVEQVKQQQEFATMDWAEPLRAVALDVSALIADKDLDFDIRTEPCLVHAHEWMLREMARNLLHNAIRLSPRGGRLSVSLLPQGDMAELHIEDSGPGISDELRLRLFQPFAAGHSHSSSGLGLTITHEMVKALGGRITLNNLYEQGLCNGLDACVRLPIHT